jgi:hypothetical protein
MGWCSLANEQGSLGVPSPGLTETGWLPECASWWEGNWGLDCQSLGRWAWLPRGSWGHPSSLRAHSPWQCQTSAVRSPLSTTLLLPSATCLPKAGPVLGTARKRGFLGRVPPKWLLVPCAALPPLLHLLPLSRANPAALCKLPPAPPPTLHFFSEQVPAGTRAWGTREVIQAPKGVTSGGEEEEETA